tara:strand:- start:2380 stop:2541 length:162 start_codon:yes stop_codon:yes gene_type:complete
MKTDSPCIGLCELKKTSQICKGCFRTIDEITNWKMFSEVKKKEILKLLEKRKK